MSGGQIAALIVAILLLLPGGCFMIFGIGFALDSPQFQDVALLLIPIGLAILGLAGFLFWLAFRRRRAGPGGSPPPQAMA
jgi:membrane protein implicated in regulation of membrane protease activity